MSPSNILPNGMVYKNSNVSFRLVILGFGKEVYFGLFDERAGLCYPITPMKRGIYPSKVSSLTREFEGGSGWRIQRSVNG